MLTLRWTLGAIVAATAVSASTDELQFFSRLLKRQEPGTPEYNCHDNCGQAIIQARNSDDVCTDDIFLTDYQNCLQCSGPDNVDIWRYYGGTLSSAAEPCGLATTPLSGEQPDVGPAIPAGSSDDTSTTATSQEATSSATPAPTTEAEEEPTTTATTTTSASEDEETSAAPTTATTTADETTSAPTSTAEEGAPSETQETTATTGYATELPSSTGESVSATSTGSSAISSGSVTPAPSATQGGNGTATSTTSSVVQVTNAANALSGSAVGFYGALALGAWYAVAQ